MIRRNRSARPRLLPTVDRLEARSLMAFAGALDTSFGVGGLYTSQLEPGVATGLSSVASVVVEPDGSILEAGIAGRMLGSPSIGVVKLTAAGKLDTTFGANGEADVPLASGSFGYVTHDYPYNPMPVSLLVEPDSKILVVGTLMPATGSANDSTVVELFNPDGTPDIAFGRAGQVLLGATGQVDAGSTFQYAAIQSNGQIVLAGSVPNLYSTNGSTAVAVTRLNTDGTLDFTYGVGGLAVLSDGTEAEINATNPDQETATGLEIGGDGKAVVVASSRRIVAGPVEFAYAAEVFRLTTGGTQDATLSQAGLQSSGLTNPAPGGLAFEPDGQIVAIGTDPEALVGSNYTSYPVVTLLNADGSLAKATTLANVIDPQVANDALVPDGLGIEPNGDVVIGINNETRQVPQSDTYLTAIRLTPDLAPDATFGIGGLASIVLPVPTPPTLGVFTAANTIGIGPTGQVVVAGVSNPLASTPSDNVVARLEPTGTSARTGDFNGDGIADPAIYLPSTGAFAIADSTGRTPGKVVPFGIAGPGNTIPAPGNYYGTGQDDVAAYLPTIGVYAVQDPTGRTTGIALPLGIPGPGQTIPVPGDYYGTGQDDIAIYLPAFGAFAIKDPSGITPGKSLSFGIPGLGNSIPVPGDYYGTGQTDIAVYLPATATWAIQDPTGQTTGMAIPFGPAGKGQAIPVPGDYDGSGKTELAVYIPALAEFIYRPAKGGPDVAVPFGAPGVGQSLPVPADYTGSGRTEPAVYLPSLGILAYRPSVAGEPDVYDRFGIPGPGRTVPVTNVVLPSMPGTGSGSSIGAPGAMGEPDALDFVPDLTPKKPKPGAHRPDDVIGGGSRRPS